MAFAAPRSEPHCAFCKGELEQDTAPFCKECGVSIHLDCWDGFGGCATPFCTESPGFADTLEDPQSLESYGQTFSFATRFCPNCGEKRIGIFCANCGADFVTLEQKKTLLLNGRPSAELIDEKQDELEDLEFALIRGKDFDRQRHCLNCGAEVTKGQQCGGCLYDN